MRIPRSFQLMGYTISVEVVPRERWQHDDALGGYLPVEQRIYICEQPSAEGMLQCFLHELTHAILSTLNYEELSKNEQLVDNVAGLLHQALTSASYEGD